MHSLLPTLPNLVYLIIGAIIGAFALRNNPIFGGKILKALEAQAQDLKAHVAAEIAKIKK